jgi:simple sugar transport system permease protein
MTSLIEQSVPLFLAAAGALWTEAAGVLAISIEGWMTAGGFFAYTLSERTGSLVAGTALAASAAALLNYGAARFVIASGADSFIVGLSLNLGLSGAAAAFSQLFFGTSGVVRAALAPEASGRFPGVFFTGTALAAALLTAYLLRRTPLGLRLRASGLSPEAAREQGVNPDSYRALSWAAAGFCAALAGAALTFRVGVYTPGAVAGRGWLALAAVYLGFRSVRGIVAASLALSLIERLCAGAQKYGVVPAEALSGVPALLALIFYAFGRVFSPRAAKKTGFPL